MMSKAHIPVRERAQHAFNPSLLVHATAAIIDLGDPMRTNVKMSLGNADMYADLAAIRTLAETGSDRSGTARTIMDAWERALSGRLSGSNLITLRPDGILHIHLLGVPQGIPIPSRAQMA